MERPVIIFVSVVTVISFVIAVLLFVLFLQRRRQRALLMLSIAQEEAERRRRKRKKAGLRSWEIDLACPQALIAAVTHPPAGLAVYAADANPAEYAAALADLRAAGFLSDHNPDDAPHITAPAPLVAPAIPAPTESLPAPDAPNSVPSLVISLPAAMETCVICLDDIVVGARVRSLPCQHVYHAQCIRVWLRRKNACPCCCVKVVKRRRKRPRPPFEDITPSEPEMGTLRADDAADSPVRSATPTSPRAFRAATDEGVMGRDHREGFFTTADIREGPAEISDDVVIDVMEPRSKSMSYCEDRPRLSGGASALQAGFPRNASLLDPDDPSSEVLASEASSHLDEPAAAELMFQVRRALRGEASMISLNTSVDGTSELTFSESGILPAKSELDEDSFREDSSVLRHLDLESDRRREMRNQESNQV